MRYVLVEYTVIDRASGCRSKLITASMIPVTVPVLTTIQIIYDGVTLDCSYLRVSGALRVGAVRHFLRSRQPGKVQVRGNMRHCAIVGNTEGNATFYICL
ncbi:hypothetical protein BYT27DRAFT_6622610 [Phlegmacium glaucopus]|nr:hypothetical protein BYT27DRAFT_6622610 [Phlegmacium glaucopus]